MKKEAAKTLVLSLWQNWDGDKNSAMAPLAFYTWLQNEKPEALDFNSGANQYTLVSGWVR